MSKSMSDFQNLAFYATAGNWADSAWDINDPSGIWKICDGKSLPFLRWQGIDCGSNEIVTVAVPAEIQIYPNPVKDELIIENGEWGMVDLRFTIYNLTGKQVVNGHRLEQFDVF